MSLYEKRYRYSGFRAHFEDVDITSLLDILVILLVFLIKNYSASPLEINLAPALEIMTSQSKEAGQTYTLVQVNKDLDVFLKNNPVGNVKDTGFGKSFLNELKIEAARDNDAREIASQKNGTKVEKVKVRDTVNFVIDQSVKYETINLLMDLVAQSDYTNYKFIVRSRDE